MIYELFEGFSEGFMVGMTEEELNAHFSEIGVTLVYAPEGRHVYIDDRINKNWAEYYIGSQKSKPVTVDWEKLKDYDMIGYAILHPYW